MFTTRETALMSYKAAMAMRTRPALGEARHAGLTPTQMCAELAERRAATLRNVEALIARAQGERQIVASEPTDAQLDTMLTTIRTVLAEHQQP